MQNDSEEGLICTFECIYCKECVENTLKMFARNVEVALNKDHKTESIFTKVELSLKFINIEEFLKMKSKNKKINPSER